MQNGLFIFQGPGEDCKSRGEINCAISPIADPASDHPEFKVYPVSSKGMVNVVV